MEDIRGDGKRRIPGYGDLRQRRAILKGIILDGSNGSRNSDALQRRARQKGFPSDGGKPGGQRDTFRPAIAKSIVSDFLYLGRDGKGGTRFPCGVADQLGLGFVVEHTVGRGETGITGIHPDGRQSRAVEESRTIYIRKSSGQRDALQRRATGKGIVSDVGKACRQRDALQRRAIVKGILSDGGKALGQGDALQRRATVKGMLSDPLHSCRQRNALQLRSCFEGIFSDVGNTGRNAEGRSRLPCGILPEACFGFVVEHAVGCGITGIARIYLEGRQSRTFVESIIAYFRKGSR